jgi:predicted transposase YdaD
MKESSTYQAILEEGRSEGRIAEARKLLLLQGNARFGPPDDQARAVLERTSNIEVLEGLFVRLPNVSGWHELLALS